MFESPAIPLVITGTGAGMLSAAGLWAYSVFVPRCQFWGPVIRSLPQREGVALTFDDGPDAEVTPRVLEVLAAHGVKGTFFVIGKRAKEQAALLKRIHAEGHAIGNHSLDHEAGGWKRDRGYWDRQLRETQAIVADAIGVPPLLFRPPLGYKTRHIAAAAAELKLPIIGWSVGSETETTRGAGDYLKRINGFDILLLHDGKQPDGAAPSTADILPALLAGIAVKGLEVAPLIASLVAASDQVRAAAARTRTRAESS